MATFEVPYAPGKLEAVAMKDGREVARFAVETTGAPVALRLTPDRPALAGDGWDAMPITVEALDAQGRPVPTANSPVTFALSGPGEIIGHGNGDPNSHEPEKGENRRLFNGLAQVIVRSQRAGSGPLVLRATSEGLAPAELTLTVQSVPAIPAVPPMTIVPFPVAAWRLSPATTTAPDPNQVVAENDQNSWVTFRPGQLQTLAGGNWAVLRGQFTPPGSVRADGGRIRFAGIAGRAEIWLDGKLAGTKTDFADKPFEIALPAGEGARTLSLRLETQPDQPAGLSGLVKIEPLR
jgi:beta-galactosidase